jgi:chromosome segregation ATPase
MLDIQTAVDILQTNIIPVTTGLGTGLLVSWLFLRPKIGKKEEYIEELEKSTKKHAKQLKERNNSLMENENSINKLSEELNHRENTINKMRERINMLSDRSKELISEKNSHLSTLKNALENKEQNILELTKRTQEIESIEKRQRLELNQRVEILTDLQGQLQERNDKILSLKEDFSDFKNTTQMTITERETHIDKLSNSIEVNAEKIDNLNERIQEKEYTILGLQEQLSKKEENLQKQKNQFNEQNLYIKNLTEERSDFLEQIQKITTRAEDAEAKEIEMGNSLKTKDLEYASLQQRTRRMQDDFNHITGIGQKISSTLKHAGIKSFSKLATTDVKQINEILEKENPALLKLSNPSTWPEQARIAAEGDWEALSNLQNSIKATKTRTRAKPSPSTL